MNLGLSWNVLVTGVLPVVPAPPIQKANMLVKAQFAFAGGFAAPPIQNASSDLNPSAMAHGPAGSEDVIGSAPAVPATAEDQLSAESSSFFTV